VWLYVKCLRNFADMSALVSSSAKSISSDANSFIISLHSTQGSKSKKSFMNDFRLRIILTRSWVDDFRTRILRHRWKVQSNHMLNHYFGLFSCIEYVNFEYKQYEQFIFDSFFEKILGKHTKLYMVFYRNNFINFRFIRNHFWLSSDSIFWKYGFRDVCNFGIWTKRNSQSINNWIFSWTCYSSSRWGIIHYVLF